jgi:hypothetical protein
MNSASYTTVSNILKNGQEGIVDINSTTKSIPVHSNVSEVFNHDKNTCPIRTGMTVQPEQELLFNRIRIIT